jgi:hypothetical protein
MAALSHMTAATWPLKVNEQVLMKLNFDTHGSSSSAALALLLGCRSAELLQVKMVHKTLYISPPNERPQIICSQLYVHPEQCITCLAEFV